MATEPNGRKLESQDAAQLFNQITAAQTQGWSVDRLWYEDKFIPGRFWRCGRWVRTFYCWAVRVAPRPRIITHFGPVVEKGD